MSPNAIARKLDARPSSSGASPPSGVDFQLDHIERYLREAYEYENSFAGIQERFDDARRLKEKIRPMLIAECIADADLDGEDICSRIEELVDELI